MRIGDNPQRNKLVDNSPYIHQVIMPVYIPNLEDYYKESFEVFKISIHSLIKTVHPQTFISIIANGCCNEVVNYIFDLLESKQIHEFINTTAIGKVNAILKGLAGAIYPLVTITDADVLFDNNWQQETYEVFNNFKKCGVVSLVPNPTNTFYLNYNLIKDNFFNKKIREEPIRDKKSFLIFGESINQLEVYKKYTNYYTISNKNIKAVVGAGHFIATYKTEVFNSNFERFTKYVLGGNSVGLVLDEKAANMGLWRLSTLDNYAYHMGNTLTPYYLNHYNKIINNTENPLNFPILTSVKSPNIVRRIYIRIIKKVFESHKVITFLKKYKF